VSDTDLMPPALREGAIPAKSGSASAVRIVERQMVLAAIRREGGNP
jgi:hypothetical protein